MPLRKRLLPLSLGCFCAVATVTLPVLVAPVAAQQPAPPPIDPAVKAKLEAEAEVTFQQGETKMKVASYDDAIAEYRNVLKRYPDTDVRYKAQFRMADALVQLKKEADAITLLNAVVKEENPIFSPKALIQLGDVYAGQQKYADAFRAYRQIVTDYPDSPSVDRAYYAIGSTHFRLGHFELAAAELEKVGTSYASRISDLQRVSPGEPLQVRITEPNLVADDKTAIAATVTAKSGDRENVSLRADMAGGDRFRAAITTKLGTGQPGNGILELHGNDTVTLTYKARYVGGSAESKTVTMAVSSNARLTVRDTRKNEVRGVVVSDTMTVEVEDPDRDSSDAPDTISVDLKTKKGDTEKVTLTETGAHTGIFQAGVRTARGAAAANSGTVETGADLMEGSATQYDDSITITYLDEQNLLPDINGANGPRKATLTVSLYAATQGSVAPVQASLSQADLEIKSLLYQGRSLNEIGSTYRDLGQEGKSTITFRRATDQFQTIIQKYPNAPEVEDALYGLFQTYIGQDQYDSAIAIITQITQKFPQSSRASEALFELATLHVKREEYDRALAIYQNLVQRAKGSSLAEDAQYAIATTYIAMLKPRAGDSSAPVVTREMVVVALQDFVRNYPESERTPEAMFQLVNFRFDGNDYAGVVDTARQMVATFPDNIMTGRVLLLQGQAQIRLRKIDDARDTLSSIIANYGGESDSAQRLLTDLNKKYPPKGGAAAPTGGEG